jgi:ribosomal protein S18 acetylase RimI-like enzyme
VTSIALRRLRPEDVDDYVRIRLLALRTDPESFGSLHDVEAARPVEEHAKRLAGSMVFGAYDGETIVGMAGFRQETGRRDVHKATVWGVFVDPACRGRGVACMLMAAVIEAAQAVVEQLLLNVVEGNAAALALYRRLGFAQYGLEPRSLKTPTGYVNQVLMVLIF